MSQQDKDKCKHFKKSDIEWKPDNSQIFTVEETLAKSEKKKQSS